MYTYIPYARLEVFTAVKIQFEVSWTVTPCSVVDIYYYCTVLFWSKQNVGLNEAQRRKLQNFLQTTHRHKIKPVNNIKLSPKNISAMCYILVFKETLR